LPRFTFKGDRDTGNVAVFEQIADASDDAPLNDPFSLASLQRTQIHSAHVYPSTTPELTQTVAVTIPAQAANAKYSGQFNLFAHGKGQPCMVEGRFMGLEGQNVAINGTVPVDVRDTGHATWVALGATNTHVVAVYFGITHLARAAFTVTIEASAYDFLASGPAPSGNPALPIADHVKQEGQTPPYSTMGRGRIDTRRRYVRRVA